MIFITDDSVVLEAVLKEDCKGCYFNIKGGFECDSPFIDVAILEIQLFGSQYQIIQKTS